MSVPNDSGITKLLLKSGTGKAKILINGKGAAAREAGGANDQAASACGLKETAPTRGCLEKQTLEVGLRPTKVVSPLQLFVFIVLLALLHSIYSLRSANSPLKLRP